eukprot:scaffold430_cov49-Attheya_sp.AAC.4
MRNMRVQVPQIRWNSKGKWEKIFAKLPKILSALFAYYCNIGYQGEDATTLVRAKNDESEELGRRRLLDSDSRLQSNGS